MRPRSKIEAKLRIFYPVKYRGRKGEMSIFRAAPRIQPLIYTFDGAGGGGTAAK